MSISYSLFKNVLRKSIVDSMYKEIISKTARYYHWLGKENTWRDFLSPFIPSSTSDVPGPPANNFRYDLHVRRDILTVKSITASDVSYVVPRINWIANTVYDMYDDAYNTPIEEAINWTPGGTAIVDNIIKYNSIYYRSINGGTFDTIPPTHVTGTVTNGSVQLSYLDRDTFGVSGATSLETSRFYVLTSEFNVYKCIWNNLDIPSTVMPTTTPSDEIVTTADGYKWKFMYTIPVSLRNRFLSTEWMPVTTALKAPFFSNGEITSLTIDNPGSGYYAGDPEINYADGDIILVSGDGYLENNPYVIEDIEIIQGGSGYTLTTGTYSQTGTTVTITKTAHGLVTGQYLYLNFTSGTSVDGSYLITKTGDNTFTVQQTSRTTSGNVEWAPPIAFSAPDVISGNEKTALGYIGITSNIVTSTTLADVGFGYDDFPAITVPEPIAFTALWQTGERPVSINDIIKHPVSITVNEEDYLQEIYYEVTSGTELGENPPTHTTGAAVNGNATLTVVAKRAILKAVLLKTEADLEPIIESGQITGVIINDGGIGYTNANIQIFASNGTESTGSDAVITANFSPGNVNTLQADVELDAIPGTIEVIKVVDPGSGYGTANIEILGDGTGATAVAVISAGQLSEVIITNPGIGYTWTDVVITGAGTGATARAIMSPLGGHGSNAIDELNANSLMFYSSISRDKNQGIEINNDYRKAGLVKNLKEFGTGQIFKDDVGSGCVLIEGNFDPLKIDYDLLLQKDDYKNYRVVDFTDTKILLSVFNNFTLNVGDVLTVMEGNNTGYSFSVTDVTERTIDQFSGDLLFLTVREPYSPTAEQIITLRTVITI
jgi:hypothetical protein